MGFFSSIADAFSRDGVVTKFTEKLPVVGFVTAGVQAAAGNGEHAKRALATTLNSTLTTAGTVGGFMVGGPVGAVAGGALASSAGIGVEYAVSTTIDDQKVKGNTGDTSLTRFLTDGALAGVSGMVGGGGTSAVVKQVGSTLGKEVGKQAGSTLVKSAVYAAAGQVGQATLDTVTKDSQGQSQDQQGQTPQPPKPQDPPTKGDDKDPKRQRVRAVSPNQAAVGSEFCRLLALAELEFQRFGGTISGGNQPLTVDLCAGQLRDLEYYFVVNVLHAQTLLMWDGVVEELRVKLEDQNYAGRVRQAIIDHPDGQGSPNWVNQMVGTWNRIVNALLNTQALLVDAALAGDANYMVFPEQIIPVVFNATVN